MAKPQVSLLKQFAYINGEGKEFYFTRDNQDTILDIVGEDNLQPYIDGGIIGVTSAEESETIEKAFAERQPARQTTVSTKPAATHVAATTAVPAPRKAGVRPSTTEG